MDIGFSKKEINVLNKKREALTKPDKYVFKNLPITLEHKMVRSDTNHEELLHWHDEVELIRIKRGNIHCHVNDSDFLLNPGELCFINFNQLHRVYNTNKNVCDMDVLTIKTDILTKNAEIYDKYIKPIVTNKDFAHVQMDGRNSYAKIISDIFDILYEMITEQPDGYELDVIGYVYMLFRRLYLVYISQDEQPVTYVSDITLQRRMSTYIYEHYQDKIKLDDIASAAGVSRSKCTALFKKYTQKTPITFLNSYRLEMSSHLLTNTSQPISQIALSCGFGEQSYFNRMFMREFDCTPLEWRNSKTKTT